MRSGLPACAPCLPACLTLFARLFAGSSLSQEERTAFFVNVYNALMIHATVVRRFRAWLQLIHVIASTLLSALLQVHGVPNSMLGRKKFFSVRALMLLAGVVTV